MVEPFSLEDFLQDQPQCKELTGERLDIAYAQWLEDIYNELTALRREEELNFNPEKQV